MNPPKDAVGSAAVAVARRSAPVVQAGTGTPTSSSLYGKAHAVPVRDVVSSSSWLTEAVYRGVEIPVALITLTVALPVMLIEAALIRWDSPGPALFVQERLARSAMVRGRDLEGRTDLRPPLGGYEPDTLYYVPRYFRLVKFRTMYHDARSRFPELYAYNYGAGEFHRQYTADVNDPRLTRIGRILRKLSLDELPNLWCVLAGHMRLVGPRPEAPEFVQHYTPEEMYKFAVKPGVTGLFQINGRGLLTWGEQLAWDLKYVRTRSVWLDLKILLLTVKYIIVRYGAF
jgi:lipopolysaccharide/colanic/teichoic acid biosynthesis glycosyltransferase